MTRFFGVVAFWMYMASAVIVGQAKSFWGSKNSHGVHPSIHHHHHQQQQQQHDSLLVPDTIRLQNNDRTNDRTKRHHPDAFKEDEDSKKSAEVTSDEKSKDEAATSPDAAQTESSPVGVKAHHKKSNAVGDPDDGSDDSDDDSDLDDSEWEEIEEELEELMAGGGTGADRTTTTTATQVQVEMELVEDGDHQRPGMKNILQGSNDCDDDDDRDESNNRRPTLGGGGVGLRLGQRLQNHRRKQQQQQQQYAQTQKDHQTSLVHQEQMLAAWQSYVYAPPSPAAWSHLKSKSRMLDGASKVRLDRRTLYSGLLLEWKHASATYRKFLEPNTSQALQAALSMATQPQWRRSFPRANAIRLYDDLEPDQGCTLAMQETIAMALAHSLGAGVVILDDKILSSVRQQLLRVGFSEQDTKPGLLIQSLLSLARQGRITARAKGSIAKCMERDLQLGLDDPFDERATDSCGDMAQWEESWSNDQSVVVANDKPLPLVIFVRAQASNSLLKSKSAVETLLQECNSRDSTNLVILGKGIDSSTVTLPKDIVPDHVASDQPPELPGMRNTPGAAPWFGFSPHNQNASGQNDPEGSRRFNIFLARTTDPNGAQGILGAIAPPEAGNLFPHMMAMQARERLQHQDDGSPIKAELERWAQMLQQQMQTNGGLPLPPPQFFNASLSMSFDNDGNGLPITQPPPPEVIQETLQQAMSELLDRLSQISDGEDEPIDPNSKLSPNLHKAFAQVLRNENLRRGIAQNLSRAVPALSDPKCQGVMLSVYVPPPADQLNRGKLPDQNKGTPMGGWFQKILNSQEDSSKESDAASQRNSRQRRTRTMAAAAAVLAAKNAQDAQDGEKENKADRNLARLESLCRPIVVQTPSDPVRAKSWDAWISRERGAVIFRHNRRVLNDKLEDHFLSLQEHTGTRGAGSSLRQMLSVRDISDEMDSVIKCAIELEAAKSQLQQESPDEMHEKEASLDVDITLSQLLLTEDGLVENTEQVFEALPVSTGVKSSNKTSIQFLHPSSLESALSTICRISPSPSGGLSLSAGPVTHRSRDEISALAQDKHERALISQVVSPQDIGVTYDMIGGLSDVKELLRQSITYPLKFPHLYSEGIAREAVKGVLLFGPPGTGKTMLAKAVATEGGASFLSVDASSVENKWLGESEKNAKAVFTLARRLAPCVIFIDEVDSLLSSREGSSDDSAHGTLTSVKTTMMSEWDGLNSGTNGSGEAGSDRVVVIGSTNRPFDLDEAVLRRFPRRILVDLPDLETRKEILEVTLAENRLDPAVNLTKIAERLDGYTGSDIKEVCREAVVQISHEQAKLLDQGVFNTREDVTQGSLQRLRPVTPEDFERALSKLKRSVSEKGKELARVWEWNDEYGEIKREKSNHLPHLANMYL